jgi:hypothetical protein
VVSPATLAQARLAKPKLTALLDCVPQVVGIGIAALDGGFGLKVNLESEVTTVEIPDEIDQVPVITEVVGRINALRKDSMIPEGH